MTMQGVEVEMVGQSGLIIDGPMITGLDERVSDFGAGVPVTRRGKRSC